MGFIPAKFICSLPTGASVSNSIDLGANYGFVWIEVPTMTAKTDASTPIYVQASSDGTTFRRLASVETNTIAVGVNDFFVASSVSNRFVNCPSVGFRYLKMEVSGTVTGAGGSLVFNLVASGY